MNLLSEYFKKGWTIHQFREELTRLIKEYNKERGSYLLIYAGPTDKGSIKASIIQEDYYVINDFLFNKEGQNLDVYLETPGGAGNVAEDIVNCFRSKFESVCFMISGVAKSAGTIMALSGDDIFMTETGSLGPIDAQTRIGRSQISTSDYIEWVENQRKEALKSGSLNPFDATMIAQISPGELNGILHQNKFAQDLVKKWLPKYKFKNWKITETRELPVTEEMKKKRAEEIAKKLAADSERWRIHGKSIKINDLNEIKLKVVRVEDNHKLCEIVRRIHVSCRLLFELHNCYKIFATIDDTLLKMDIQMLPQNLKQNLKKDPEVIIANIKCQKCNAEYKFYVKIIENPQIDIKMNSQGFQPFPSGEFACKCGNKIDLTKIKNDISNQIKNLSIKKKGGQHA